MYNQTWVLVVKCIIALFFIAIMVMAFIYLGQRI